LLSAKQVNQQHKHNPVAALNEALKSELQRLKVATGQMGNQMMMNFAGPPHAFGGGNQQVFHHPSQAMPPFLAMQQQHQQNWWGPNP